MASLDQKSRCVNRGSGRVSEDAFPRCVNKKEKSGSGEGLSAFWSCDMALAVPIVLPRVNLSLRVLQSILLLHP